MARLPQQAWSLFIKIYHQLLPSAQHSSVHQQVIFVILIIKIQISATARKRKEDKIFWPDRDLLPSQLAKSPLRAPNNEQKRKRSMIRPWFLPQIETDPPLLPTTSITNVVKVHYSKPQPCQHIMDPIVNLDQMMDAMDDPDLRPLRWIIITTLILFAFVHITCTTIMLSGIPNRVDSHDLREWLDKSSFGHYDFSYLRIDFSAELNVGHAFVNFTHSEHITNFVNAKVGKPWSLYGSNKRCEVSYATIQRIDCLLAKFRNSVIMEEAASCRPRLWYHHESDVQPDNRHRGGCFVPPQALVPP
ncbi:hypothetical protein D6D13_10341 [Aureobasidium pullulans]|uniref:RRM domain-containing protein n=1 Tax=Aureobasidium pullulans TaxID=5580 RepID=A0A4S9BYG4_AURPU|nr:hypothetical protein D6D13_10341 [Aureobasidium pullulans]